MNAAPVYSPIAEKLRDRKKDICLEMENLKPVKGAKLNPEEVVES